ncbi:MAG: hypothetical protein GY861_18385 [bacterium]|nr:hypothetical protein [bacterium]
MEYSAIKVKIGKKPNGHHLYPSFNDLQCVKDSGMDWSKYVDVEGLGWHYDKVSGHAEETADSPRGQQWGVLIIPEAFADQAVAAFPDTVSEIDETALEDFYDNKAHAHEPDERISEKILTAIKMKQDLGLDLTPNQEAALDPDDDTPGITKNKNKKWADKKAGCGATIKAKK